MVVKALGLKEGDDITLSAAGKHALEIEADKVSESAKAKIEKAGGTITMRGPAARKPAAGADNVDQTAKEPGTVTKSKKKSTTAKAKKKASKKR